MAALTIQTVVRAGLEATYVQAEAGGDTFVNTGKEIIQIRNGGGSDVTLTVGTPRTEDGLALADRTVNIPAGKERFLGAFQTAIYGTTVSLAYSGVGSLTLAVLKAVDEV